MRSNSLFLPIVALLLVGWVYGVFFVDFGGQTLASHTREVWHSKLVQTKVDVIGAAFTEKCGAVYERFKVLVGLSAKPQAPTGKASDRTSGASTATTHSPKRPAPYSEFQHEFSPKDRKELDSLIIGGR